MKVKYSITRQKPQRPRYDGPPSDQYEVPTYNKNQPLYDVPNQDSKYGNSFLEKGQGDPTKEGRNIEKEDEQEEGYNKKSWED